MEAIDRRTLYEEFLKTFPIDYLKEMPLEKYTNLNKEDSFCYWLEFKTKELASIKGGASFKFGIYRYNKRPKENNLIQTDESYAWYRRYNKTTAEEAYNVVRDSIVSVAEHAQRGELESIDKINILGDVVKWKIAFIYSNGSLVPIFNREMLNLVSSELGMKDPADKSIPYIQRFLMLKKGDEDIFVFYDKLLDIIREKNKDNSFSALKDALKEKLKSDNRFSAGKSGAAYLWVTPNDFNFNTKECHFEICNDKNKKASHSRDMVYVEFHCESPNAQQYKDLSNIPGIQEFPWNGLGVRANEEGWRITDYSIDDLADILIEELYNLDDLVGEKAKAIMLNNNTNVNYWTYSPGEQASKWDLCTSGGVMCIGWDALGDLSKYSTQVDMNQAVKQFYPTDGSAKNDTLAVWQFANEMKPGDIVFAKKGRSTIIGRGIVTSDYIFDDSLANYKHIRKVNWTNVGEWESNDMHAMKTLTNVTRFKDYVNELEGLFDNNYMNSDSQMSMYQEYIDLLLETRNLVLTGAPGTGKTYLAKEIAKAMDAECDFVQFHPSYDYTDFVEGLRPVQKASGEVGFERKDGVFKEFCKKALRNWEDSNKTADEISEEKSFEDRYNELIDRIEDGELNEFKLRTEDKKLEIVKVSDLNNIILRAPATESERTYTVSYNRIAKLAKVFPSITSLNRISNISHEIRAAIGGCNASAYWAVLREIYKQKESKYKGHFGRNVDYIDDFALAPPDNRSTLVKRKKYVFIIDEINRGEISKIFGELFFSVDPGYRGVKGRVKTQYQNLIDEDDVFYDGFYVPENVYILATMNDIDRSVESMDFAMRRRFTWKEVTPSDTASMLNTLPCSADAKATMLRLNNAIEETEGLGASYMVGPSYFLKLRDNGGDFGKLWRMNIEPLLKEYLRGFRKSAECLRKFRETYFDIQANSETEEIDLVDED